MGEGKTALVLSAGGMFGAYQAGVYKALAGQVQVDMVVGASVGALNGWLIASGCPAGELIERWLHPDAGSALRLVPNAGWRNGWFDPLALQEQTERIAAEFRPVMPFGVVTVQVPRMHTVLVRHPEITAAHLQATCSIPLFLPAVRIGKQRYVDGGFFEKLPVWAAAEMGATRIIAVDSLPDVAPPWLRAGMRTVRWFGPRRRLPAGLEVTIISPSEFLGSANDAVIWRRENVARWIALGERDGERFLIASRSNVQRHYPPDHSPAGAANVGASYEG